MNIYIRVRSKVGQKVELGWFGTKREISLLQDLIDSLVTWFFYLNCLLGLRNERQKVATTKATLKAYAALSEEVHLEVRGFLSSVSSSFRLFLFLIGEQISTVFPDFLVVSIESPKKYLKQGNLSLRVSLFSAKSEKAVALRPENQARTHDIYTGNS